ncbi:hypothetical protein [Calothrix sp. UHCC 0171]|uniref:hypothetical protein n=1 Tax=Calothrix sp. UHCC 0171 TaxID=3110245 RepID=UPI002B20DE5E|nr:hypothetical protein [Calothrix sp. UHCC 0171]MEA5571316.1 hypothetical protein [Calothrix sp. UHCC 0171]
MAFKEIVDVLNALLTPVIAGTTVYIAWQQYQVSRLTLRKDLYEKRLRVYQAFMSYLSEIVREGKVHHNRVIQFYAEASEGEFLFDAELVEKADELYKQGIQLWYLHNQLYPFDGSPGLPVGDERSRVAHEDSELLEWFINQISTTRELFRKQMSIQERRVPSLVKLNGLKRKKV